MTAMKTLRLKVSTTLGISHELANLGRLPRIRRANYGLSTQGMKESSWFVHESAIGCD